MHDDSVLTRLLLGGEIALGETYVEGLWDSPDLDGLMRWAAAARSRVQFDSSLVAAARQLERRRVHARRKNSRAGSRANIHAHYDDQEAFFTRLLDSSLSYSAGIFAADDESLDVAQRRKHAVVCRRLGLESSDTVLDIGSGWGAFATYAARERGCRVEGVSVSRDQVDFVERRVRAEGLDELVSVALSDYRDVSGTYKKIVCLGMLEHVGHDYLAEFFRTIERPLDSGGLAYLQFGAVPDDLFASQRRGTGWTQQYMFPGAELPSLAAIDAALRGTDLAVVQMSDLGRHCALTCYGWLANLRDQADALADEGMNRETMRAWEFYLAGAGAAFLERTQTYIEITLDHRADDEALDYARGTGIGE